MALEYGSGIIVYLSLNTYANPEQVWATMADKYPEFSTGNVRGTIASLADPKKSANGTSAGGVDLVEGGLRITVSGNGSIGLDDLKAVTESLRQNSY